MKEETLYKLNDSVLKLGLSEKALASLEYLNIFTIRNLLKQNLSDNKELLNEITTNLANKRLDIKSTLDEEERKAFDRAEMDSKATYKERNERDRIIEEIEKENEQKRKQIDIDSLLKKDIEALKLPEKVIIQLKNCGIKTIEELLLFNAIELFLDRILKVSQILKVEEVLNQYGLTLNKINNISELTSKIKTTNEEQKEPEKEEKDRKRHEKNKERWYQIFNFLKQIYENFGHIFIPQKYIYDDIDVNKWLQNQKYDYKKGTLPQEYIDALDSIEIVWEQTTQAGKDKKKAIKERNGIVKVKLENNEMVTYYKDGTIKSTADLNNYKNVEVLDIPEPETPKVSEIEETEKIEDRNIEEIPQSLPEPETPKVPKIEETEKPEDRNIEEMPQSLPEPETPKVPEIEETADLVLKLTNQIDEETKNNERKENLINVAEFLLRRLMEVREEAARLDEELRKINEQIQKEIGGSYGQR